MESESDVTARTPAVDETAAGDAAPATEARKAAEGSSEPSAAVQSKTAAPVMSYAAMARAGQQQHQQQPPSEDKEKEEKEQAGSNGTAPAAPSSAGAAETPSSPPAPRKVILQNRSTAAADAPTAAPTGEASAVLSATPGSPTPAADDTAAVPEVLDTFLSTTLRCVQLSLGRSDSRKEWVICCLRAESLNFGIPSI